MTYLSRLQSQRNEAAARQAEPAPVQERPTAKGRSASPTPLAPDLAPLAAGAARPAPKMAQGLSSAMLRQTIGDVFARGADLGLSAPLVARFARALEGETAALADLGRVTTLRAAKLPEPARSVLTSLFARTLGAAADELGRFDAKESASVLRELIAGMTRAVDRGLAPSPAHAKAIEVVVGALSAAGPGELGALLLGAIERISAAPAAAAVGFEVLADHAELLLGAAPDGGRAAFLTAALDVAARAIADDAAPKEVVASALGPRAGQLTPGQTKILGEVARDTTRRVKDDARGEKAAAKEAHRLLAELTPFEGKLAQVAPLAARAQRELGPVALAAWLTHVDAARAKPELQLHALSAVLLEVLARRGAEPLPDAALRALERATTGFARTPGVTHETITRVATGPARTEAPERLAGVLEATRHVLTQLEEQAPQANTPALATELAYALSGRAASFAKEDGPGALVVGALVAAKTPADRVAMASWLPRFAEATRKAEAGGVRDTVEAHLAADAAALAAAGISPAALAAAHPKLPEDALPRLAAIALGRRADLDGWLGTLTQLFSETKGSKERARSLRSLFVLADECGASAVKLGQALRDAKLETRQLSRTANALLDAENRALTKESVEEAIAMLGRGEDVAAVIETRLRRAMVKELDLDGLLERADLTITQAGVEAVTGPLADFFAQAVNDGGLDRKLVKGVLIAALEDRIQSFRFDTKPAARQLKSLTEAQRRVWEEPQAMNHVRLPKEARKELDQRIGAAAAIGRALEQRMSAAWGGLEELRAEHGARVAELRELPKNAVEKRRRLVAAVEGLPARIHALEWAREVASLTPDTTTPLRFARLGETLPTLGRVLGPNLRPVIEELLWTIRIDDLRYSEVVTNDGPSLSTMVHLAGTNCLGGNLTAILAYCIDPNKKMIVTKNQAGEERRSVMRLVERKDRGHVGEPMLVLERTYPDSAAEEEKQRLVEHMLRRASDLGIAAAYPTEYYWNVHATSRFQHNDAVHDTKAVIEDLNRRYHTTAEEKTMQVLNRAGNMPQEYIDSAPVGGAADAGNVQQRLYPGQEDTTYENVFLVLEPQAEGPARRR